jgi:putative restriction endonuclease
LPQPRPWLDEIIDALKELGGHGTLSDICDKIEERNVMDFISNKHWRDRIRGTIYHHSSDCDIFTSDPGGEKDIFYSVDGKGNGHWGLRDFKPAGNNVDLTEEDMGFPEGKKKLRQHIFRERNPKVIKLAKEKFKLEQVEGFSVRYVGLTFLIPFANTYGEIGEDFIEGHHTIPVSELKENQVTNIKDIAIVCSNCHRMLHRRRPWLTKEKLKAIIYMAINEYFASFLSKKCMVIN